jgi:hypothetical protein
MNFRETQRPHLIVFFISPTSKPRRHHNYSQKMKNILGNKKPQRTVLLYDGMGEK